MTGILSDVLKENQCESLLRLIADVTDEGKTRTIKVRVSKVLAASIGAELERRQVVAPRMSAFGRRLSRYYEP
jgi:hypothetical protein